MAKPVRMAFETQCIILPIDRILPLKQVKSSVKKSRKYKRILASVREVGIIEPLCVFPEEKNHGRHILIDGHMRLEALKELHHSEVPCLVSKDDESYTVNKQVAHLSAIQEHFMIVRAIKRGVSVDLIARALDIDARKIEQKSKLLDDICQEAQVLLKNRSITANAIRLLKKVVPIRQIEIAELMIAANNYTLSYAKALYAATPQIRLMKPENSKKVAGVSAEDMAKMERELEHIQQDFKAFEETYGRNVLNLVLASGYLSKLLNNNQVVRFLSQNYQELLLEFRSIIEATSLES